MEAKELLTRIRCKKDERIMWIALTEKGQQLQETVKDIPSTIERVNSAKRWRIRDS